MTKTKEIEQEMQQIMLEKQENLEALSNIKAQIGEAKAKVEAYGEYSDPIWFAQANNAMRIVGKKDQRLAMRMSYLKGELKKLRGEKPVSFDTAFVDIAKLKLSGEMFNLIRDEAMVKVEGYYSNNGEPK